MDEIIKLLDVNLEYIRHEIIDNTIYIEVKSTRNTVKYPYCGVESTKVHSYYKKSFQDLPIQGNKVIIFINNRKMFCNNISCAKKTFAETFLFITSNAKTTTRLQNAIINLSINVSSLSAEKIIKSSIASVGKSTICNLLKK